MTDVENRLLDDLATHGILRRVEYVQARMRLWDLTTGDACHLDVDDPTNLDPEHPQYVRADHPALPGYYARITAEAAEPAEPDDLEALRRRAGLD